MREVEDGGILLTRKDMYVKVWRQGQALRKPAPEWGLSGVGLKKLCKRLGIPTPPATGPSWRARQEAPEAAPAQVAGP